MNKKIILLIFLLIGCNLKANNSNDKIFIFSGQSNATNIGNNKIEVPINENVLYWEGKSWIIAKNPLPGEMINRVSNGVSIWPSLGNEYFRLTNTKVKIAGYANSGQPISHWNQDQLGWMELSLLIQNFCTNNTTFIWYQGESNSSISLKFTYAIDLNNFLQRIRNLCSNIKIVIISLGDIVPEYELFLGWDFQYIRNIQNQVSNALIIKAEGLPLQDNLHLSSESLNELGIKIAREIFQNEF